MKRPIFIFVAMLNSWLVNRSVEAHKVLLCEQIRVSSYEHPMWLEYTQQLDIPHTV
jgi:hypothetical protein